MTTGSKSDQKLQRDMLRERVLMSALLATMFTYAMLLGFGTLNAFEIIEALETFGGVR